MKKFVLALLTGIGTVITSCSGRETRETKYDNAQLHEQFYVVEAKDGSFIREGDYKSWYRSGQLESTGRYQDGKRVGQWKYYFSDGQIKIDCSIVNELVDGQYTEWYSNGQKLKEGIMKMGIRIGPWATWYKSGKMQAKLNFDTNGNPEGISTQWYDNGLKASEEHYFQGHKEGESKKWNSLGTLFIVRAFRNGVDINLPALYKNDANETIELMPDETYRLTYQYKIFNSITWLNASGKFEVTPDHLKFGEKWVPLKKFKSDTIVVASYFYDREETIFTKQRMTGFEN